MKKGFLSGAKILCCIFILHTVVFSSFSQSKATMSSDCTFGNCVCIQGSLDLTNLKYSSSGSSSSDQSRLGFNLGVFVFHPLPSKMKTGSLALTYGLEFIQKGSKYDYGGGDKETITLGYLEVPVDLLYEYKLQNCSSIFGGVGVYLAYGLGGKDKYTYSGQTVSSNSFSDSTAKRFDAGFRISAGYRMSCNWSASIVYEFGILNIGQSSGGAGSSGYSVKNHLWSFNFAYCLGDLMGRKK
ncbi:MAG TPA: porin family protein [Puia sp.]|nr:porin family protein [Puia sp.]